MKPYVVIGRNPKQIEEGLTGIHARRLLKTSMRCPATVRDTYSARTTHVRRCLGNGVAGEDPLPLDPVPPLAKASTTLRRDPSRGGRCAARNPVSAGENGEGGKSEQRGGTGGRIERVRDVGLGGGS
jgi:hypothetical protein